MVTVDPVAQQAVQQWAQQMAQPIGIVEAQRFDPYLGLGLVTADPNAAPQRVVLSLAGFEKTGKTHFSLTGREPIVIFNMDKGTEGVVEKFVVSGKQVYLYNMEVEPPTTYIDIGADTNPVIWRQQWREFASKLQQVYALKPGTVIIDTLTEVHELARLAHFGKLSQVQPHMYGPVNEEMKSMTRLALAATSTTTVFLHKMGYKYQTGEPEVKGWNQIPYVVQANIQTGKIPPEGGVGIDSYYVQVKDCRLNPHLNGFALSGDQLTLEWLEYYVLRWKP